MRKYVESEKVGVEQVVCNICKKEIKVENGIICEGVFSVDISWGYFSEKDGQIHSFDLCEKCYDEFIKKFAIPADIVEAKELI